jgi:hypothetical protein
MIKAVMAPVVKSQKRGKAVLQTTFEGQSD